MNGEKLSKNPENGAITGFGPAKKAFAVPEELENKPKYENMFERRDI